MSAFLARPLAQRGLPIKPLRQPRPGGFSLVELLLVLVIVAVLAALALPSYRGYAVRASRVATQAELLQMASTQEKIYLNSQSYAYGARGIDAPYDGSASGGLGFASGRTRDGQYELWLVSLALSTQCSADGAVPTEPGAKSYVLLAKPVAGGLQQGQASLCVADNGRRLWGNSPW